LEYQEAVRALEEVVQTLESAYARVPTREDINYVLSEVEVLSQRFRAAITLAGRSAEDSVEAMERTRRIVAALAIASKGPGAQTPVLSSSHSSLGTGGQQPLPAYQSRFISTRPRPQEATWSLRNDEFRALLQ
jgi:hypothetical protein